MERTKNLLLPVERITSGSGHFFFGYYDVPAWSGDDRLHLCHKVRFMNRLPRPDDVAVLGTISLSSGEFAPFAETTAWNFQQGSMLQWVPSAPNDQVIYNRRDGDRFVGVVRSIRNDHERLLERPVAAVSPTGGHALSISFSRLFNFRPGYGYAGIPDPHDSVDRPSDDGIYLVDLDTGKSRLIISLEQVYAALPESIAEAMAGDRILINHISFNTDGTRFFFLPRNNPRDGGHWSTGMLTADISGADLRSINDAGMASHYNWRDARSIVCYSRWRGDYGLFVFPDEAGRAEAVDPSFFAGDGHCSYSPDRRYLLYDSYPIEGFRYLYLYDLARRRGQTLGAFWSDPASDGDIRCDLHPRWSGSGRRISFDSTHEGSRHIYAIDLSPIIS